MRFGSRPLGASSTSCFTALDRTKALHPHIRAWRSASAGCSKANNLSQLSRSAGRAPLRIVGNIEFDLARYLEDSFWMLAILAECVFERLLPAREQAAKNAVLFADDPVSETILANKDPRSGVASGRIFNKLHNN